ncbi:MAG: hypothetical protein IT580_15395, partial [Verrucomicrobiales bacterium]|nr:hypothetical protein [Verrucomicrobiales bacterium]
PTNTWRISGVDYEFPPGFVMPPGGTLLVVGGDPVDFRIRWQSLGHIPVLGPWSGELQRDGERLELLRPDAPDLLPDGSEWVPQLVVDAVRFDADPPWPPLRERAYGVSLERKSVAAFGDDPASWRLNEDGATPGTFATGNRAPTVSILAVDPLEVTAFPVSVELTGAASDDDVPSDPGRLILRWTSISGPGVPVFTTTNAAPTRVTLPGPGLYRLRLTAFDGELSGTAEVLVEVNRPPVESMLIPSGATWRYWDQGPVATTWTQPTFDDRAWPNGPAQLGYGDGDERTVIRDTFNGGRLLTAYFRQSIQISQPAGVRSLTLRVVRDDGALVWINGREVMRSNVPEGLLTYESTAPDTVSGADESGFYEVAVDPAVLRAGTNVVAVEVHQQNAGSSDISFDLELRATTESGNRAPQVEAGPDQTVVVPSVSTLSATWADDGLPAVAAIRWRQVEGPATAIWSATNQAAVQVELRSAGVYGFEVAVDDGEWVVRDTVKVVAGDGGGSPYELWRAAHFSAGELADPRISGEGADPDGDGQSNRAEFDSGTRPRDAASVLRLRVSTTESGGARLVISIVPSRSYEVQVRPELGRGDWTRLHRIEPVGSEGEVTVSDPGPIPSGQARYYQVITPAPGP